ncbi:MAG: RdgB/HAM1 family non-canonical purine NTP pyrophosphatase [Bacteroidales bacterium]|nr:RdgB/HAM1 family non-canonical purine NTP pyrophosphatase [Bacteroidales bacterium]MBD5190312.1 RdgB/HAM1 family non-canonical purine NTP pyrophosphatase [Bacteroidales bacterium]MBD5209611.1 RdgB/HAM1 family non-canonical purine NTP pyrophosphatase [Bacteroidales bacterium]
MKNTHRLVFATNNMHKLREVREIIGDKFEILSLSEAGVNEELPETSDTLEGNAFQKARRVRELTGLDCFADDTGLMVDALDGAPGVYSARYAGEHCSPEDNMIKLLKNLDGVQNRSARFMTVIAVVCDKGEFHFEGAAEGSIALEKAGANGFGYDPIFISAETGKRFAEMSDAEKNSISHRGRAVREFIKNIELIF